MSTETEIREFLTTRRAKLTPERVGCPPSGASVVSPASGARRSPCWRDQRRVLHAARARQRPRRLRGRPRVGQRRAPAGRGRAWPPRDLSRTANAERPPRPGRRTPEGAAEHRRIVDAIGRLRDRAQRAPRHAVRERARRAPCSPTCSATRAARTGRATRSSTPGRACSGRTGSRAAGHGCGAPRRGRPQPVRRRAVGPHRGAVDAQRGLPVSLGAPTSRTTGAGRNRCAIPSSASSP